jgi:hypothetical protein
LIVLALFVVLELFTNLVLESVLYAGAVGVSQVVLLVSVTFWTWLWGPLGLLMASPLTVCLVVLGKHVPGLAFVELLMDDTPPLALEYGFYQSLVARDQSEAAELIDSYIKTESPTSVYDALLLPALSYAERDRLEHRLSSDEEMAVIDAVRELITDAAERAAAVTRIRTHPPRSPILRSSDRASPSAYSDTRSTGPPMKGRSRCWHICWTICQSPWRSPGRACRRWSWRRWWETDSSLSCASRIFHPARRRKHGIW